MMFWVCFGIFSFCEIFTDVLFAFWLAIASSVISLTVHMQTRLPFYYEIKIIMILWLMSPYANGARIMYKHMIHPNLTQHEQVNAIGVITINSPLAWSRRSTIT